MNAAIDDITLIIRLVLDILAVWALIYLGLRLFRNNSRTVQILKGILVILVIKGISVMLGLHAFSHIMDIFLQWGVLALIIVFQPEIRGMLERLGKTSAMHLTNVTTEETISMINEIVDACEQMSKSKTGALITIQQIQELTDYINTGIRMDSVVSSELLGTIFQYGTPMHDGAVIIQGNKIACAAAYFPPTSRDLPSKYGARHRAAVGISEITDSITIVVSEETGAISLAVNGQLTQYPVEGLRRYLLNVLVPKEPELSDSQLLRRTAHSLITRNKTGSEKEKKKKVDERIQPIEIVDFYNTDHGGKTK
ncbi:MAG: diadenylate cyclase CdaA [Absicoccus porci]|uniref:Diadenylate cyclase n=1 Tax=Absicoccus porci TaxID=2486576 RepID=A0A3N0HYA2_9FIRM|nr:diadenylate cyclase CdaA [Absicoccus porci]MCI6087443.1 diadenylate cyclase CdaA [Absicoccus porci]MDD6460286.1 diadenylate cyclase CdaA [Absicoccus porci]MDD7330740.1 diadenylate cyclase CdaA [Absicoccus porci]MDY4738280.1 diadenylate cyclase CdaA [Absicoccus porci]MEE1354110.1 diadenylate cyclase CdaA [Absicoccus porci]